MKKALVLSAIAVVALCMYLYISTNSDRRPLADGTLVYFWKGECV